MKNILLVLLLTISVAWGEQAVRLGQLLEIDSTISYVDVEHSTVWIGSYEYVVDKMSSITVNGKRGSIQDLATGLKVTGSAEITALPSGRPSKVFSGGYNHPMVSDGSGGKSEPTRTLRMLHATGEPAVAQSTPAAANPQPNVPQMPPQMYPQGVPGGPVDPNMPVDPALADFKQKIGGTFWMLTLRNPETLKNVQESSNPDLWFSLNADGSVCSGWAAGGTWMVYGQEIIMVRFFEGGQGAPGPTGVPNGGVVPQGQGGGMARFGGTISMRLAPDFAKSSMLGGMMTITMGKQRLPISYFKADRVDQPTQEMLAKVAAAPPIAAAATPTPAPVSAETQNSAAEVVRGNSGNLVFVTGKEGAGSGFIATLNGSNFLVTNAHVAAGINDANFKTLGGEVVKGDAASVAVGHDIFCTLLPAGGKPFEIMKGVDENAKIGDDIVVLGNAEGSGVVNTIMGKIVGIGPNLVEVDAQFVPGNSGSPIIHIKSGKVIGVATYLVTRTYDAATHEKMATPQVRRYGYRIDSVKTWQPVNWRTFYAEAAAMEKVHTLTGDLDNFFRDIYENHGKVTISRHTNPAIKNHIAQWLEEKGGGRSMSDRQNADASFLSFLKIACQSDLIALQGRLTYDYFQRELATEQETRTEMAKAFSKIIEDVRK